MATQTYGRPQALVAAAEQEIGMTLDPPVPLFCISLDKILQETTTV
jgi:hypothetical protein